MKCGSRSGGLVIEGIRGGSDALKPVESNVLEEIRKPGHCACSK